MQIFSDSLVLHFTNIGQKLFNQGEVLAIDQVVFSQDQAKVTGFETRLDGVSFDVDFKILAGRGLLSFDFMPNRSLRFAKIGLFSGHRLVILIVNTDDFYFSHQVMYLGTLLVDVSGGVHQLTVNQYPMSASVGCCPSVGQKAFDVKRTNVCCEVDLGDLISQDQPNALKLGSDDKLLSQHPISKTNFLAYYLLMRGTI